jgi:signal transduction histidine kinase/CheY-like chemotaxis protein
MTPAAPKPDSSLTAGGQTTAKSDLLTIFEKSTEGLLVVNARGLIRIANPTAAVILNRPVDALVNAPFDYSIQEEEVLEIDIKRRNGKMGTGELRATPVEWEGQKAYLVSIRDVTERAVYDRLKDEWIHNVSHEIRTPLTSMRESISLMYDGVLGPINEEQKNFLSMCLRNADHLKRILNNLLDISKIEAKKARLDKKKTDLTRLVRSAADLLVPLIENKKLSFSLKAPESAVDVYVDRDSITQVMNNLIGNALKFTESGGIEVSVRENNGTAECAVSDTGRGIAGEDLPKVFDKFQQFGMAAGVENRGTGLGLSISKAIVQLHGGTIAVDSVLERGTTFTFSLPVYGPELEMGDQIQKRMDASKEPFVLFGMRLPGSIDIDEALRPVFLKKAAQHIRTGMEDAGRKAVPVWSEPDHVLMWIDNPHDPAFRTKKEILRRVKEVIFDLGIESEPDFAYGIARFPHDGTTPAALLEAQQKNWVEEKSVRLSKRILVVDDERELTEATRTLMELFGYRFIDTANNGLQAFDKVQAHPPDLIILDMKMPGMSGYEVIGRLKEHFETKDIPILIMSGYEVETGGFNEYISKRAILTISKPVDGDLLRKMAYYLL